MLKFGQFEDESEEDFAVREAILKVIDDDSRALSEKMDAILAVFEFNESSEYEGDFSIVLNEKTLSYERRAFTVMSALGSVITKLTIILGDTRENILMALNCLMGDDEFIQNEQEKLKKLQEPPPSQELH